MQLLDELEVIHKGKTKTVGLYHGDLTDLNPDEFFDLLVVSAFPNNYVPIPSSMIGALDRKGLSVDLLAKDKEIDLRKIYSCWLSKKINPANYQGLQFSRILCFEPLVKNQPPPELIGDIFQSLLPMTEQFGIKSIAMPIVNTGSAKYSISKILPILLEASINWLNIGLDLDQIKIVAYTQEQAAEAKKIFSQKKNTIKNASSHFTAGYNYDCFISYSRVNTNEATWLHQKLVKENPQVKIFLDKKEIKPGFAWQQEIFNALDDCQYIYTLLSPEYLKSKVCLEEYHIAHFRQRESDQQILIPIYLYSAPLPTFMKLTNYIDCREGSQQKIEGIPSL